MGYGYDIIVQCNREKQARARQWGGYSKWKKRKREKNESKRAAKETSVANEPEHVPVVRPALETAFPRQAVAPVPDVSQPEGVPPAAVPVTSVANTIVTPEIRYWSKEDDASLLLTVKELAQKFNRSERAIVMRIQKVSQK